MTLTSLIGEDVKEKRIKKFTWLLCASTMLDGLHMLFYLILTATVKVGPIGCPHSLVTNSVLDKENKLSMVTQIINRNWGRMQTHFCLQWIIKIMIQYSYVHFIITHKESTLTAVTLSDRGGKYYYREEDCVKSDFGQWKQYKVIIFKNYKQILIPTI